MQCYKPRSIHVKDGSRFGIDLKVPCGYCLGCRIAKRQEWVTRLTHELVDNGSVGVFLTLTYNSKNLPYTTICASDKSRSDTIYSGGTGTLVPEHLTAFWKRLRENIPRPLRYYAVGEYGEDEGKRPHYHAILFNVSLDDLDCYTIGRKIISRTIEKLWPRGFNQVGTVTTASIRYVAGYIEKKLVGKLGKTEYENRCPPFSRMSQGIGRRWCDQNGAQLKDNYELSIKGMPVAIPKYYKKRLDLDAEKLYQLGSEKRKKLEERYRHIYDKGGEELTEKTRRQIAVYRETAMRTKLGLKSRPRTPYNSGSLDPEFSAEGNKT